MSSTPQDAAAAVRVREFTLAFGDVPLDVVTSCFTDRVMVVATQLDTLGAVVHARKEAVLGSGDTFRIDTVLGSRADPMPPLVARQLVERLCKAGCELPLVLCLGLLPVGAGGVSPANSARAVHSLVEAVMDHPVW